MVDAWRRGSFAARRRSTWRRLLSKTTSEPALAAPIGDSDALRVGDLVVAVGNPMGERNAPSVGILASAPHDVLRLAITLRPGNSGGALVNARGEVVGIPHMVTGSGLALAVSTRTVRRFLAGAQRDEDSAQLLWV